MTIHHTRTVAGALLAVSTLATGLTAGSAQADDASSERATAASAPVPARGSWAVGYSAVIRSSTAESKTGHLEVYSAGGDLVRRFATPLPSWRSIQDVSHDARFVITSRSAAGFSTTFQVWDVAQGRATAAFTLPNADSASFTDRGILTVQNAGQGAERTTLRTMNGAWTRTLPSLGGVTSTQVSPGGTLLMQSRSSGVALRRSSDGRVVRTIPRPAGMPSCYPFGLWGHGYVKIVCNQDAPATGRVYAVSTRTGRRLPVTPFGYADAWPTSGARTVHKDEGGIPDSAIGTLVNGRFIRYFSSAYAVLGVHGAQLWVINEADQGVKLYNARTRATRPITGAGSARGGYVADARTVDTLG